MENESKDHSKKRSAFFKVYDFLAGFHLATISLVLLLVLTWLATLEQIDQGLYPTLNKYFSWKSLWLLPEINGKQIPFVLPGGYYVSALLLVNMIMGGIIRIRKGWKQAGNLISHFGIVFMLIGGGVAHHFSERGNMAVSEGQVSNVAVDYHEYVVEVAELKQSIPSDIHVVRGRFLEKLSAGNPRIFQFPGKPFSIEISGYLEHCVADSVLLNPPKQNELLVDQNYLRVLPNEVETERNVAGCYAKIVYRDGTKSNPFILWGGQYHPYTINLDGKVYMIDIRKRIWPMPFDVKLEKFTADFHPGTAMAAKYMSDIRRIEDGKEIETRIEMNEPMRHKGYTFFQSSYGPPDAKPGDKMYSVFEVVKNPADHWPEYSLYGVAFGMLVTFLTKLGGHVSASAKKRKNAV